MASVFSNKLRRLGTLPRPLVAAVVATFMVNAFFVAVEFGYITSGNALGPVLSNRAGESQPLYVVGFCLLIGIVLLSIAKLIDLSQAARWWLLVLSLGEFEMLLDPRQPWLARSLGYASIPLALTAVYGLLVAPSTWRAFGAQRRRSI